MMNGRTTPLKLGVATAQSNDWDDAMSLPAVIGRWILLHSRYIPDRGPFSLYERDKQAALHNARDFQKARDALPSKHFADFT